MIHRHCRVANSFRLMLSAVALVAVAFAGAFAADAGPDPASFGSRGLVSLDRLSRWDSPAVDLTAIQQEDAANAGRTGVPLRIGFPMKTDLSPANSGTWETLPGGDRIWRLQVRTKNARWVVLGFDIFRMQEGGSLWVYDPAAKTVLGPRTVSDHRDHGELWFPPIAGDTLIVELLWPARLAAESPKVHLGVVSHGYKPFGTIGRNATEDIGDSGSCNIDTACPLGAAWQDEKRGAVILLNGGSGFCSGSLINTTANDCRPYVLTANHCNPGASTAFGFNFERPACNSGTPGPATTQSVAGATVLATFASSDFALLQMNSAPPDTFNAYFNGWSHSATAPTQTIVIHHPSGDVKKIAFDDDPSIDGSNWGTNHWRVQEYEQGTTEPGSSGSPLFDQNSRIIGQLHGGTASCTSITYDEYGKVFNSWTGGGAAASRMSNWLDPEATGAETMDGVDWSTCAFNPIGQVSFNRTLYACNDTLAITVEDDNLPASPDPVVLVTSSTEPDGEQVTLTENPPGSQKFTGTINVTSAPVSPGDGQLSVSPGDTVDVTYNDDDDGSGGSATASDLADIDCTAPGLSNVQSSNVTGNSADITWLSTEGSNSVVHYGTTPPGSSTATSSVAVVSHSVHLAGLLACQLYYYWVESSDAAGNTAYADNAGDYYTFSTGQNVTPTFVSTDPPVAVPATSPTPNIVTINVLDDKTILDVDAKFNMTHTYDGDNIITLRHPDGTIVSLSNRRGTSGDNFVNTVFDDEAATSIAAGAAPFTGSFKPETVLAALDGKNAQGVWQLLVLDNVAGDSGTITGFELKLTYPSQSCGPNCEQAAASLASDTCVSGSGGSANGYWDDGEEAVLTVTLRNTGSVDLTGVSATLTPITAGVTLLDDTAGYPTIPRDTTAVSTSPHFTAQLDEGFPCGAPVEFQVVIHSDQGDYNDTFTAGTAGQSFPGGIATALFVDFSSGIPAGWTVVDGGSGGGAASTWTTANPGARTPTAPITDPFATVDSDNAGMVATQNEELITAVINLSAATAVTLEFDQYFKYYALGGAEKGDVDVRSSITGGAWVNVLRNENASSPPLPALAEHKTLDITAQAAGASDVQLRFHYYDAAFDWHWQVDNVKVTYPASASCTIVSCDVAAPVPPEVTELRWDTATSASWTAATGATSYSLYRGTDIDLPKLYTGDTDSCLRLTTAALSASGVTDDPPAGTLSWWLVRASNGSGTGPAGSGSAGPRVQDTSGTCP